MQSRDSFPEYSRLQPLYQCPHLAYPLNNAYLSRCRRLGSQFQTRMGDPCLLGIFNHRY